VAVSETHDLGRFYWHAMRVTWKTPPLQLDGVSYEVEEPWRVGRCLVLRLFVLPYALVLGWWGPPRTYEDVLAAESADDELAAVEDRVSTAEIREDFRPQPAPQAVDSGWTVR
jgi:hypothetical protein